MTPQPPILQHDLTTVEVTVATGCPATTVAHGWPLLLDALKAVPGAAGRLSQIGLAATVALETAHTFKPIREYRANAIRKPELYAAQERYWPSGYYGRGYIQLTWADNYRDCGEAIGEDLLGDPDLVLDPAVSARAAVWFWTNKGIPAVCEVGDWPRVRKLVNGGVNGLADFLDMVRRFGIGM